MRCFGDNFRDLTDKGTSLSRSCRRPEVHLPVPKPTPTLLIVPLIPPCVSISLPLMSNLVSLSIFTLWCVSMPMTRLASGLFELLLRPADLSSGKYIFPSFLPLLEACDLNSPVCDFVTERFLRLSGDDFCFLIWIVVDVSYRASIEAYAYFS